MDGRRRRLALILIPTALASAAFAIHLSISLKLDSLGGFAVLNTFFGADANRVLEAFSEGGGRGHLAHPNLGHFFSLPIRAITRVASLVTSGGVSAGTLRRVLALFVVPLAAALQCFVTFRVFVRLGFPVLLSTLVTLLGCVSFSQLVFGSIPESFGLSGLALALVFLLTARKDAEETRVERVSWLAAGIFGIGVTITNVVPLAALRFVRERTLGTSARRAAGRAAGLVILVLLAVFALRTAVNLVSKAPPADLHEGVYVASYLVPDPGRHAAMFGSAVMNGLAPSRGIWAVKNGRWQGEGAPYRFTMQTPRFRSPRNLLGLALLATLVYGFFRLRSSSDSRLARLCGASLAILAFNWLLHAFWGEEQFLYSQHWQLALLVLIGGLVLSFDGRGRRIATALVAAAVLYVGVSNAQALRRVIQVMEHWASLVPPA